MRDRDMLQFRCDQGLRVASAFKVTDEQSECWIASRYPSRHGSLKIRHQRRDGRARYAEGDES